jgi:hypothetical protein
MQYLNIVDFFLLTVLFSVVIIFMVFIYTVIQYVKDKKTINKHLTK